MIKLNGFDSLVRKLGNVSQKVQAETKEIIAYNLGEIELQAIRDAPGPGQLVTTRKGSEKENRIRKNQGVAISQGIGSQIDSTGYKGTVYVETSVGPIAAWVEFGTGQSARQYLVSVPKEWRDLARTYYINGRGTILAQPYLLPAFLKYQLQTVKELEKMLKDNVR